MTIKEAIESTNMTYKECAEYLGVPLRTLQDWAYGKRIPKRTDLVEKILALSVLTKEGRDSMILNDGDWDTALLQYKIETARMKTECGMLRETFSRSLRRIPEECIRALSAEQLALLVDAMHQAYVDGEKAASL